jgi:hypothetical protein
MAGYSGTPLPRKLGIAEESRVALVSPPDGFTGLLEPLPAGVDYVSARAFQLDVIVLFVTRTRDLERRFEPLARHLQPAGGLWVAWPKKSSGVASDLSQTEVMEIGLASGALVDTKVAALDETWSGLRFVVRKAHRDGWPAP